MNTRPVIRIEEVSFSYGGPPVLEQVSLEVEAREFLGLVGPNGGGKSTLLNVVLGLLEPTSGTVSVLGRSPREARRAIGYVPQQATFARDFPISVEDAILLGRLGKTRVIGGYRRQDRDLALQAMQEVEIDDLRNRRVGTLSGGQFQRMLIARALVADPQIMILDEPTANIDLRVEEDIFDLFKELNKRMALIVVSHDIGFISQYVTRVACLNRTLVCHRTADITGEVIDKLYGTPVRMIQHVH